MLKRNPGKQPGAPDFGRQQQLPVSAYEEHRPTHCACCGKGFKEAAPDKSRLYRFYTLDIECGDPEAPGLRVTNTQYIYHETRCDCGHLTREEPGSQRDGPLDFFLGFRGILKEGRYFSFFYYKKGCCPLFFDSY